MKVGTVLERSNSKYSTLVGNDDWLYIWGVDDIEGKIRGTTLVNEKELEVIGRNVELRAAWSRDRGIAYRHMIGPDKSAIYPQFLPEGVVRGALTTLDQCRSVWSDPKRRIHFIDTEELLTQLAKTQCVYFKNDAHWNYRGALAVFNALADSLVEQYPGFKPYMAESEIATSHTKRIMELIALSDDPMPEVIEVLKPSETDAKLVYESMSARGKIQVFESSDDSRPRCVLFRDSYASFFLPFLAARCSRLTVLNTRHYLYDLVEAEKPDIVVSQVAERFLLPHSVDLRPHSFHDLFRVEMADIVNAGSRGCEL